MPAPQHAGEHADEIACAVITVSDTRTPETDTGGQCILSAIRSAGYELYAYEVITDDPERVRKRVQSLCADAECHAVLLTGGTGVSSRDTTVEAVSGLFDKRLDGFGELFRMLSFDQVGAAAMLSRAVAGIVQRTAVFVLPGSPSAVDLAMQRLINPELSHIVHLIQR